MNRSQLMLILFVGVTLVTLTGSVGAQGAKIRLDPALMELSPGEEGTVAVRVSNISNMAGAELHLTFDPVLLEVMDADPGQAGVQIAHGDFLSPDFVAQNDVDVSTGTIDYAIACLPADKAVSGDGVLARISFRALSTGKTQLTIRNVILADQKGVPIDVEVESGFVTVRRTGPSPAVWVLIVLAALAVVAGIAAVIWNSFKSR